MAASKDKTKKTMDVAKPGESAPDTSARPVLVTHRPMVQDPMVKEDKKSEDAVVADAEPKTEPTIRGEKVIQPVNSNTSAEAPADDQPATPAKSEDSEPEPPQPEKTEEDSQAKDAAVVDAVVDQATEDKKKQNKLSDEEKAKQEALQKLIEEKKYFVPVGQVSRRRNRRALLTVAILVLLLIGGYLAIDAGLIKTTITLPIDLIKS